MPLDIPLVPINSEAKVTEASNALQAAIQNLAAVQAGRAGGGGGGHAAPQDKQLQKIDAQAQIDAWKDEWDFRHQEPTVVAPTETYPVAAPFETPATP